MTSSDLRWIHHVVEKLISAIASIVGRVQRLEAENKELRALWSECEKTIIEHKVKTDELNESLNRLLAPRSKE